MDRAQSRANVLNSLDKFYAQDAVGEDKKSNVNTPRDANDNKKNIPSQANFNSDRKPSLIVDTIMSMYCLDAKALKVKNQLTDSLVGKSIILENTKGKSLAVLSNDRLKTYVMKRLTPVCYCVVCMCRLCAPLCQWRCC